MALSGANLIENVYNDRVLLLQDNNDLRRVYEEHLEFSGYEVHCADTVMEANNILEYVPVNLIVSAEFINNGEKNMVEFLGMLRNMGTTSWMLILTEDEERVWDQIDENETRLHTFPIPDDLDEFLKSDVNQFVSIVAMVLDELPCVLIVNDSNGERIELENMLISKNYRICSVPDGNQGIDAILQMESTKHPFQIIVTDIINRYYPGFMFLDELFKQDIKLPSIVLTSVDISLEKIYDKTRYDVSCVIRKNQISAQLIPKIQELI